MSTLVCTLIVIVAGAAIGLLGRYVLFKGSSLMIDLLLGIAGAVLFNFLAGLLKLAPGFMQFTWLGLLFSILGACIAVAVYGFIQKRRVTA